MTSGRAVSPGSLGAWLLKVDPAGAGARELLAGGPREVTRCVRRSYRTFLMEPGQPVLLWVSGRDARMPAGVHAQGRITGVPQPADGADGADARQLEISVHLVPVDPPVLRAQLLADPLLSRIEVVRMPAGSNPSYLGREELARLRELLPTPGAD
ncbi:hypothetical protein [Nocardioides aromaticivorans]|nr:hypothetical protein [Nocardioides aromaticivorans]